jgi:photosystem II stability/assembly factor-like uncharacterized protein
MIISGWLQPVDRVTEAPLPSPTMVPQTPIVLPTTAELSAPSKDVVWVLVASTLLFRSTDRGTTWEQRTLPPRAGGGRPPVFSFVDADNGWYFVGGVPETQCNGAGAEVWRTTDGAATWQFVAQVQWTQPAHTDSGINYAQCKDGLSFIDSIHGFLGGWDPNHRPTVYRTSDGGKIWSASTLPDPPGFVSEAGGSMLRLRLVKGFGTTLLALADANRPPAYVFRSTDGGATWAYLATASGGSTYPAFLTATRWLVIYNDGSGQETTDAGKSWHSFSTDYADAAGVASTFTFAEASIGYGTVRGGIKRTADGGSHWTRIGTPGVVEPIPSPDASPATCRPGSAAGWRTYSSTRWGYSIDYPAGWCDLGRAGAPDSEQYFSNEKWNVPRFDLTSSGIGLILSVVSGACPAASPAERVDEQTVLKVNGQDVTRTYGFGSNSHGSYWFILAAVTNGENCLKVQFLTTTQSARDSNLTIADRMITSIRFG